MKIDVKRPFGFSENGYEVLKIAEGKREVSESCGRFALTMGYAEEIEEVETGGKAKKTGGRKAHAEPESERETAEDTGVEEQADSPEA